MFDVAMHRADAADWRFGDGGHFRNVVEEACDEIERLRLLLDQEATQKIEIQGRLERAERERDQFASDFDCNRNIEVLKARVATAEAKAANADMHYGQYAEVAGDVARSAVKEKISYRERAEAAEANLALAQKVVSAARVGFVGQDSAEWEPTDEMALRLIKALAEYDAATNKPEGGEP